MSVTLYGGDSVNLTTGVVTRANNKINSDATLAQRLRADAVSRITRQNDLRALAYVLRHAE